MRCLVGLSPLLCQTVFLLQDQQRDCWLREEGVGPASVMVTVRERLCACRGGGP